MTRWRLSNEGPIQTATAVSATISGLDTTPGKDTDISGQGQQHSPVSCLVRNYDNSDQSRDLEDVLNVFRLTAGAAIQTPECLETGSYIWCRPYLQLCPNLCFVLEAAAPVENDVAITTDPDDKNQKPSRKVVVGYIIGAPNVPEFISSWQRDFLPTLPSELQAKPAGAAKRFWNTDRAMALRYLLHHPEDQLHPELPSLMRDFPAHLHIDILPEYQGRGYGRLLITAFLQRLRDLGGVTGVHLVMSKDNVGAGLFYQKIGFKRLPVVMDGGDSGEEGSDRNSIWWCMKL